MGFLIALGYLSVLLFTCLWRGRIDKMFRPLFWIVAAQVAVWSGFYIASYVVDPLEYIDQFQLLSRFGHFIDIAFLWLLLLVIVNPREGS